MRPSHGSASRGSPASRPSTASIPLATARCRCSSTCPYVFEVSTMDECPRERVADKTGGLSDAQRRLRDSLVLQTRRTTTSVADPLPLSASERRSSPASRPAAAATAVVTRISPAAATAASRAVVLTVSPSAVSSVCASSPTAPTQAGPECPRPGWSSHGHQRTGSCTRSRRRHDAWP